MYSLIVTKTVQFNEHQFKIMNCNKCRLSKLSQHRCVGLGNLDSKVIFIGEAPGRVENPELRGLPFVGNRSSDLLMDIIYELYPNGYDDVYITNVVKCNPPKNRTPLPDEIEKCSKFLREELNIIKPKVIVCLGRTAANWFGIRESLNNAVYKDYTWRAALVKVLHHPSFVLRFGPKAVSQYKAQFRLIKKRIGEV